MTLPEFLAVVGGFDRFHAGKDEADEPSIDELYRALAENA
jgi:hypothetical protein